MKLLGENKSKILPKQGTGKDFLNRNPIEEGAITRLDKWVYRKLKRFHTAKEAFAQVKNQSICLLTYTSNMVLIPRVYKELQNVVNQNPHHSVSFLTLKVKVEFSQI